MNEQPSSDSPITFELTPGSGKSHLSILYLKNKLNLRFQDYKNTRNELNLEGILDENELQQDTHLLRNILSPIIKIIKPIRSNIVLSEKIENEYLIRIKRFFEVTIMLNKHFGSDIQISLDVQADMNILDVFLKMPDKRSFALMLRSNGTSYVKWRKDKQEFYCRKPGKDGIKKWSSPTSAIKQLQQVTTVLKQNKDPLLGTTRTERNRPITKVIVFTSETKLDRNNPLDLWTDFGQAKALKIDTGVLIYAIDQDNLINFLLPPLENCDK
ncbi:MAG: hypothetical protein LH613_16570 [Chamaesiphon sp.]|nr:hypothetical protein [Chamaesiphon sp.]